MNSTQFDKLMEEIKLLRKDLEKTELNIKKTISEEYKEKIEIECASINRRLEGIERKIKKNNIVIYGLEINTYATEILISTATQLFKKQLKLDISSADINNVYAIGKGHQKLVVVEFLSFLTKLKVLKQTKSLKGTNIFINNDQTISQQKTSKILRRQLKLAKKEDANAYIQKEKLYTAQGVFTVKDFQEEEEIEVYQETSEKSNSAPPTPISTNTDRSVRDIRKLSAAKIDEKTKSKPTGAEIKEKKVTRSTSVTSNK